MTALRLVDGGVADSDPDLDAFLEWGSELRGLRPNTIRVRRDVLGRMPLQTGKRLRDLTEDDLLAWERNFLVGRAPETRRAYLSHVRSFFAWAVKSRLVDHDPTGCLTQPKLVRGLPRPISEEDLRKAVELARPKMGLQILLGAFCGLRCQEIAGLFWNDLQTPGGGEQPTLVVREGKGGKQRVVPVPGVVLEAMVAIGRQRSGPMFYGLDGRQMRANTVSANISTFFKRHGINATAHQLRHRYATSSYRITKDIRLIQELLGHSSPTTTARYAAYDKSQTVDMVKALDEQWQNAAAEEAALQEEFAERSEALRQELMARRRRGDFPHDEPVDAEAVSPMGDVSNLGHVSADVPASTDGGQAPKGSVDPIPPCRPTVNDLGLLRGGGR